MTGENGKNEVGASSTITLIGYVNADSATQEHHCAITGYAFLIKGGAVLWGSQKQELVTLSTAESEYVTAMHASKEAIWLCHLIREMFAPLAHPLVLYGDTESAIVLMHNGSYHACMKHIDVCYHFIHFSIENGSISFLYCPSTDMITDTLTKALPSIKAKHFVLKLGLRPSI